MKSTPQGTAFIVVLCFVFLLCYPRSVGRLFVLGARFFSGANMSGQRKTNGTFFRAATKSLDLSEHASRWAMLPGYKRALYRTEVVTGIGILSWLRFIHPTAFAAVLIVSAVIGITAVAFFGRLRWKSSQHTKNIVMPIFHTLAPFFNMHALSNPIRWVDVPEDYQTNPSARVRINLPSGFAATSAQRKEIPPIVAAKLGGEWDHDWNMKGRTPALVLRPAPSPPSSVKLAELSEAMLAAPEHAPVIGAGSRGAIIHADLNADSPHVAFSMGSGGGKSTAVRTLAAQLMRNGARCEIIDVPKKGVSHLWAKGLSGVSVWRSAESAHLALVRLREEMAGRYEEIYEDASAEARFQRVVIVFEELNATMHLLKTYWQNTREKTDPKDSPALQAIADILFAGRQGRVNILCVAQSFTARAIGGPEARENFATRVLGRYSVNAWKMLCPEVWPAPRSSRHIGRVQVVTGGEAHACQVAYMTDAEARVWAAAGDYAREPVQSVLTISEPQDVPEAEPTYTLGEACAHGFIPMSYDAAKKARQRDKEFPTGLHSRYTEKQLREWYANRESTARKADA